MAFLFHLEIGFLPHSPLPTTLYCVELPEGGAQHRKHAMFGRLWARDRENLLFISDNRGELALSMKNDQELPDFDKTCNCQ